MFSKVENKSQWKELLDKALFKTFFHTLEWESFLEQQFSWLKFERYIWNDEFLLSIARCRFFGKKKLVSHPLCEYGGPLPMKENADFEAFISGFQHFLGKKARIKFHPYIHNFSQPPLSLRGGGISSFWIENYSKKTVDYLWRGLRKTLRQEIKGGEGQGIYVEDCRSEEELRQFYKIYLDTVRRHQNIPLPFEVFKFLYKGAVGADILLAKKDGKVLGGSVFLFYEPFIHYFLSAKDCKFRKYSIGHIILWAAIRGYKDNATYDYFDLGGTRKGSQLEVFKRGWGANKHPIYELGSAGRGLGKKDFLLRDLWGMMPNFMIKVISPKALWMKV